MFCLNYLYWYLGPFSKTSDHNFEKIDVNIDALMIISPIVETCSSQKKTHVVISLTFVLRSVLEITQVAHIQRCLKYIWVCAIMYKFSLYACLCSLLFTCIITFFFQVQCKKLIFGFKGKEAEDLSLGSRFNTSAEHRMHMWHVLVVWLGYL